MADLRACARCASARHRVGGRCRSMRRWHILVRSAVLFAAPLSIVAVALIAWPFTVDDAFVVASYARQLASGHGYSLDGTRVSDGVTGPLWLAPFLVSEWVGLASMVSAKLVGLACVVIAVVLALLRACQRQGSVRVVPALGLLLACQSDLAIWSVGGLETGAATLALVTATLGATRSRLVRSDHVTVGGAVALMAWLRPELAIASALLLGCLWTRDRERARIALSIACMGALSVIAFRLHMFGHVLPLTLSAKPAELGHGVHYAGLAVGLIAGGFGVVLFACGMLWGRAAERWVGAVVIAHWIAVMLAGGDWMPGFRLLVPVIPLYAWVAAVGVMRLRRPWLACLLLLASCAVPLTSMVVQLPEVHAAGEARDARGALLARWLREHACHVGLVDVGYLGHMASVRVFDLAGITDEAVARLPGGHVSKAIPIAMLRERAPDTLVLRARQQRPVVDGVLPNVVWHSRTEHALAHSKHVTSRYRAVHVAPYSDGYVYYVLQAPGAQLCPKR